VRGLQGKAFIVAGGATGIGAGTAERLAGEGASVTIGDINIAGAKATAERITDAGGRAIAIEFDLADDRSVDELVAATIIVSAPCTDCTTSGPISLTTP